jgi:hypothetical protein
LKIVGIVGVHVFGLLCFSQVYLGKFVAGVFVDIMAKSLRFNL